jgi:hypothetical protein
MAFLTIFTAPKPFTNPHIQIIQRNAIQSWKRLADVDVILIGDEPGIPEAAKELDVRNVPQVRRNEKGVPLVDAVMEIGHSYSDSPVLCYVNGDMILTSDLVQAARQVSEQTKDYLLVCRRWDLDLTEPFDFSGDWESRLRLEVAQRGRLHSPWGIDIFLFPHHLYNDVPNFTIGRAAWDNWMVYHARTNFKMAIDATRDILIVHQTHDYSHMPNSRDPYNSDTAQQNAIIAGGRKKAYNILDTNRELVHGRIRRPQVRVVRIIRRLERLLINDEQKGLGWELSLRLGRMQRQLETKPRR